MTATAAPSGAPVTYSGVRLLLITVALMESLITKREKDFC